MSAPSTSTTSSTAGPGSAWFARTASAPPESPKNFWPESASFLGVERALQRDVLVPTAPGGRLGQRLGQHAAGVLRVDLLVDDADLDGAVHAAGHRLVLEGQPVVQGLALVV